MSVPQWRVEVELLVDAVHATNGQVTLAVPELLSEETHEAQCLQGRNKNTFILHINTVHKALLLNFNHFLFEDYCFSVMFMIYSLISPEQPSEAVVAQRTR